MLIALMIAGVAVTIEGDTTCPSPQRVAELLSTLLAGSVERTEPHRAQLHEQKDTVEVELRSRVGRSLGRRTFRKQGSCDELASAIAVVIATWEAGLQGDTPDIVVAAPPAKPRPTPHTTFAIGGGAVGTRDRSGWAVGGLCELAIGSTAHPWTIRGAALATTRKRDPLGPGVVAWARQAFVVGVRYRLAAAGPLTFDAAGDVVLGVLMASGQGFTYDRTGYSFDPGTGAGVRMTLQQGPIGVFLEASDTVWWRKGRLEVTGVTQSPDLPRHEVHLGLGMLIRIGNT